MHSKLLGGILLVVGTTIGAGMLALPIATAQLGFYGSLVLLVSCWAIMLACAFLFLEVNLWFPANTNLISMAGATLGRWGQAVTWVSFLILLYSILSAYIAGGGDLFHYLLLTNGVHLSSSLASFIFTLLFGSVVYFGIRCVDYVNRGLMFGKMGAFLLLVVLIMPSVSPAHLNEGSFHYFFTTSSISVTAVSFTCLMIIPSLRMYFNEDIHSLRKAIFIGMLIPLICYIVWDMVIMGIIPLEGPVGLKRMAQSATSNSDLVTAITTILNKDVITHLAKFFTSICMATSFLSVSLGLSDFMADGFSIRKEGMGKIVVFALTFLPPILIVNFYPNAFLTGLNYAGVTVFILMILFPPLMAWRGRYHHELGQDGFKVRGGKFLLGILVVFALLMIGFGIEDLI